MTATQLPKPGDRFRWRNGKNVCVVVAVTENNVHYESPGGDGWAKTPPYWLKHAIPIPPKPHVEPVQWGWVGVNGQFFTLSEGLSRESVAHHPDITLAKLDHGVLDIEVGGEWVKAFDS